MQIDRPEPGFYWRRFVRNGPRVACRIWRDDSIPERPAVLLAECDGKEVDPFALWTHCAGNPITEAEYRFMIADKAWCEQHAPADPIANSTTRINLAAQPAVLPPRRQA